MYFLIVLYIKVGINIYEGRGSMLSFVNQASSFNLWEHGFPIVLRIRMTLRIKKRAYIFVRALFRCRFAVLMSNMNRGFSRSCVG